MGLLDKLGSGMIAEKIKEGAINAIDRYVESAVINALLPHRQDGAEARIAICASVDVVIEHLAADYTEHIGKNAEKSLSIPQTVKHLELDSVTPVKRPESMAGSEVIKADELELCLSGNLSGIAFKQMTMGVGATINTIHFKVTVKGNAVGTWLQAE
ncbi:MAG: hypothetical protein IJ992_02380 [Lentisphaeria bacterium]|nr:hypothetical protein [Lentisphaeria bacterium]